MDGTSGVCCSSCGESLVASVTDSEADRYADDDLFVGDLREAIGTDVSAISKSTQMTTIAESPVSRDRHGDSAYLGPGSILGDFEIIGEIGHGGMGVVYRARQRSLDREVALKVLHAVKRHGPSAAHRFRIEAQAAARLHHANVVPIYAQGSEDGELFYAMKLVEGVSLDIAIRSRPDLLSATSLRTFGGSSHLRSAPVAGEIAPQPPLAKPESTVTELSGDSTRPRRTFEDYRYLALLIEGAAEGLAHAHEQGVIHRDIKPHNLLLGQDHRLKIADFGLAHLVESPHFTVTGEVLGTPSYLAPEQVRGDIRAMDGRTDIYGLGVTLYELITGNRPFEADTRDQILHQICTVEPKPPRLVDPRIPLDLDTICLRMIQKDPRQRHQTAAEVAEDLRRFAEGRPILSRRATAVEKAGKWIKRHKVGSIAVAACVLAVVLSGWLVLNVRSERRAKAQRFLDKAYDRLVHINYFDPEVVNSDIEQATALGADAPSLGLVSALARLPQSREQAVALMKQTVDENPSYREGAYAYAWFQAELGDRVGSGATVRRADDDGGAETAEQWYFRGLAVHYVDPDDAIQCYENARDMRRLQDDAHYPLASYHIVRANNQKMYRHRELDSFDAAKKSLEFLIEQKYFGGRSYYLLAIAHRVCAEILASKAERGDSGVEDRDSAYNLSLVRFADAIATAREGREAYPMDPQLPTTEAMSLESRGFHGEREYALADFADAIDARTQAIELAAGKPPTLENLHYRWRLNFWLGNLPEALADVREHGEQEGEDEGETEERVRFYRHFFPALIAAEMGDMDTALTEAMAEVDAAPNNAQDVLRAAACLRLLGEGERAKELLAERQPLVDYAVSLDELQSPEWAEGIYELASGEIGPDEIAVIADKLKQKAKSMGESAFHLGARSFVYGTRSQAMQHFADAFRSFDKETRYTFIGKLILQKMRLDPEWPPWIDWQGRLGEGSSVEGN